MTLFTSHKAIIPDTMLRIVKAVKMTLSHTDWTFTPMQFSQMDFTAAIRGLGIWKSLHLKCPSCYQPSSPLSQNVKAFIATENFLKLAREL